MSDKDTTERGNVTVEGEIDAGFGSYWDPEKHGQTVDATPKEESGTMNTDFWPDHIDPEEMTDKQRNVLEIAFQKPTLSAVEIDERIGSNQYANQILRDKVPEWYEDVFKGKGNSIKMPSQIERDGDAEDSEKKMDNFYYNEPFSEVYIIEVNDMPADHMEALAWIDEQLPGEL